METNAKNSTHTTGRKRSALAAVLGYSMGNSVKSNAKVHPRKRTVKDPLKALLFDIAKRGERIPLEEREQIPHDFAQNIDHYLYGAPKE